MRASRQALPGRSLITVNQISREQMSQEQPLPVHDPPDLPAEQGVARRRDANAAALYPALPGQTTGADEPADEDQQKTSGKD